VPLDALVDRLEAMERGEGGGGGAGAGTPSRAAPAPVPPRTPTRAEAAAPVAEPEQVPLPADVGGDPGCADRASVAVAPDARWGAEEWKALLADIAADRTFVAAALEHGALVELTSRKLVLAFSPGEQPSEDYRSILRAAARKKLSPMVDVTFVKHEGKTPPDSLAEAEKKRRGDDRDARKKGALENARVRDTLQLFDVTDPRAVKTRVED
jgi:hypothetical protein